MIRIALVLCVIVSPALAQQAEPSAEQMKALYFNETGQLRQAIAQEMGKVSVCKTELDALKNAAKSEPKK